MKNPKNPISIFILAGGKSARMGTDKGLILLNGKPMISYLIETLEGLGLPVGIISNEPVYESFGCSVFPDLVKEKGPLGGIFTAMSNTESDHCLILSCDSPFTGKKVIKELISKTVSNQITLGQLQGKLLPFPGVYPRSLKQKLEKNLDTNHLKLRSFILEESYRLISWDELSKDPEKEFANLNTPEDLRFWEEKIIQH
jgi:molybdopterin-guanine dinucleotide biosynthesis protein A